MKLVLFVLKNKEKGVRKKGRRGSSSKTYPRNFVWLCACAVTATASNTTETRIDGTAALFIAHLVSSVIYHADRDKGKCDLHARRRQVLVEWEGPNHAEI